MLAIRLVLVVVGAVSCCCNTQLSYIYVGPLHTYILAALYVFTTDSEENRPNLHFCDLPS